MLAACCCAKGQVAGMSTLSVLDMPTSARTAALGMDYLSLYDNDLGVAVNNPSFIDKRYHNQLMLSVANLFAGSNLASVSYGYHAGKMCDFVFSLHFNSYGRFDGYTAEEMPTGKFFAADYSVGIGWGMHVDSVISIGASLKPTVSQYESYTALALAIDLAGSYVSRDKSLSATLIGRNAGAQFKTFDGMTEKLPFELSAALSYQLKNAPFRLFLSATELQHWNLGYDDEFNPTSQTDPFTGERKEQSSFARALDNTGRHAIVGVELTIRQVLMARVGFNYRRSKETKGTTNINTSGFSYGLGVKMRRLHMDVGRNNYNLGKAANYITLRVDL